METLTDFHPAKPSKKVSNQPNTEAKQTPVILVCINNVSGVNIPHELIHSIFSSYGKILRILIFEKLKIWKIFVEFSSVEAAFTARQKVNDVPLFNDGSKIAIYPSNLETVKFQSNNPNGIDYTLLESLSTFGLNNNSRVNPDLLATASQNPNANNQNFQSFQNEINTMAQTYNQDLGNNFQVDVGIDTTATRVNADPQYPNNDAFQPSKGPQSEDSEGCASEEAEKEDYNMFGSGAFPTVPKTQASHHLYQNTPLLPFPTQKEHLEPEARSEDLPPGLGYARFNFPTQPQPPSFNTGPPKMLSKSMAKSMNFIPMGNTLGKPSGPIGEPRRVEAPKLTNFGSFNQIPKMGSNNNLPMPITPNRGSNMPNTGLNQPVQYPPMNQQIQQRPQLNKKFFTQNDIPLISDYDMLVKGLTPGANDKQFLNDISNARNMNAQQGMGGLEYDNISGLDRSALSQLHDNLSMLLGKGEENKKSRVLYVKGLDHKDIKVQMLYNIFSNFGDILKIIFIPSKQSALLEFENVDYATLCIDHMNNIVFMGKPLRIYYSKYSVINVKNKKEEATEEVYVGTPQSFRFKKNRNLSINPPSATLHISNLVKECCREDRIREYFAQYGRIEATKCNVGENNKNMCLLRMSSIEEALNAMAHLHDTDLGGRNIQISFTRSKI